MKDENRTQSRNETTVDAIVGEVCRNNDCFRRCGTGEEKLHIPPIAWRERKTRELRGRVPRERGILVTHRRPRGLDRNEGDDERRNRHPRPRTPLRRRFPREVSTLRL